MKKQKVNYTCDKKKKCAKRESRVIYFLIFICCSVTNRYVPIENPVEEPKIEAASDRDNGNDAYHAILDVDNANELKEAKCEAEGKENLENRETRRVNAQIGNVKLALPLEDAAEPNETAKVPETSARNYPEQEPNTPLRDTATILQELALQRLSGEFNNVRRRNKEENYRRKDENRDNNGSFIELFYMFWNLSFYFLFYLIFR